MDLKRCAVTGQWESWAEPETFFAHVGETVEVKRLGAEKTFFHGRMCEYSDLLRGPGILQYGQWGLDTSGNSVVAALAPPPPPIIPSLMMPKRSLYQSSFREPVAVPTLEQLEYHREVLADLRREWKRRFQDWAQHYEFRVVPPTATPTEQKDCAKVIG